MALSASQTERIGVAAAALTGALAFFVWIDPRFLDPANVGWLGVGDRAMHTLGWWFFRATPWGTPPGVSPQYGLELSSSVALSDSLPLFAFPFKLISAWLPPVFQYWGFWLLTCTVLQAVFGWKLARELALPALASWIFALFCLVNPAFLDRLPHHMALGGHWVILAALYLYVRREPPALPVWPLLIGVTAAIHAYLLAIVVAVWCAAVLQRLLLKRLSPSRAALEIAVALVPCLAVLWIAGFLTTPSLGSFGFGLYRMNLLSLIDSDGWSTVLPDLPETLGDYEGFNYLGLGIMLLLAFALLSGAASGLRAAISARWWPLLLLALGLVLFAISNHPAIGQIDLGTVPLPRPLLRIALMFRASGRLFWPVGYLIILAVFVLLARRVGARNLTIVAAAAVLVQLVDTHGKWAQFDHNVFPASPVWKTPLQSPFWEIAARHYRNVRAIPVTEVNLHWLELSYFAVEHGMGSDAIYIGRVDYKSLVAATRRATEAMTTGSLDKDALYVLDAGTAFRVARHLAPADLLAEVDGYFIVAPGGKALLAGDGLNLPATVPVAPVLPEGTSIAFSKQGTGVNYLTGGWSDLEDWGIWSQTSVAFLNFRLAAASGPEQLRISATGFSPAAGDPQLVDVQINGVAYRTWPCRRV